MKNECEMPEPTETAGQDGVPLPASQKTWRTVFSVLLVLTVFFVYWPSTSSGFVWDDDEYVVDNPHVNTGLSLENLRWAATAFYSANWHPLTWLSHQADCQLYGLKPAGHHLTNIFLHLFCVIILFQLLMTLGIAVTTSAVIAAMFAFHPMNVEVVAWVAQRKSLLCMLFMLLSLWSYVAYVERRNTLLLIGSLLLFGIALCAKPMAVSLPLLLFLIDWWPLQRSEFSGGYSRERVLRVIAEKVPFIVLAAALSVVTVLAQHASGALVPIERLSLLDRLGNMFVLYWQYLIKIFLPIKLAAYYPYSGQFALWKIGLAFLSIVLISVAVCRSIGRYPWLFSGWFWFLIALVPMIGIVKAGSQSIADRYVYLPMVGLFLAIVPASERLFGVRGKRVFVIFWGAICVSFAAGSFSQQHYWKSERSLYSRMIEVKPSALAHVNMAFFLKKEGDCTEARDHFQKAINFDRNNPKPHVYLINLLMQCKEYRLAKDAVANALRLFPHEVSIANAHALLLMNIGKPQEAISVLKDELRLSPDERTVHALIAIIAKQQHDYAEAIDQFTYLMKNDSTHIQQRYNRAETYYESGQYNAAREDVDTLLLIAPDDPVIRKLSDRIDEKMEQIRQPLAGSDTTIDD